MTFLKNQHISLRALEKEDLSYLYRVENGEAGSCYGENVMPYSKHLLSNFIKNAHRDIFDTRQLRLVAEKNADCEAIGMVDLFDFSPQHRRAGVGIWIDEKFRRRTYAAEAIESLCIYAFDTLLLHQLFCHITADNTPSIRLFQKAGFIQNGTLKQWIKRKDEFVDVLVFQKIKSF